MINIAGILFIIRIVASGLQGVEPRDKVSLSRMGCMCWIFKHDNDSAVWMSSLYISEEWRAHLYLECTPNPPLRVPCSWHPFRVCRSLWCFINFYTIIAACSWRDLYQPHPHFEQPVEEFYTEFNPDVYLQSIVSQVKQLKVPDYLECELVSPSYSGDIFFRAIPECNHSTSAECEESVFPEHIIPQALTKEEVTVIVVW